jgi:sodium/potassium-transporting ATPase subunit alpha
MTAEPSHDEKHFQPPTSTPQRRHVELVRTPTIAFDDQGGPGADQPEIEEKSLQPYTHAVPRSGNKNLEMRRELTQEDKELSRANYDHLEKQKSHGEKGGDDDDEKGGGGANHADIREHRYTMEQLQDILKANFDSKNAPSSFGLTSEEAAARLARNGPNVLTPPKKKSAFQKASSKLYFRLIGDD